MNYSGFTEFAILFLLSWPLWQMLLLSMHAGHTIVVRIGLLAIVSLWIAFAYFAVKTSFDSDLLGPFSPARPILYLVLSAAIAWWFRELLLGKGVSQHLLISFQLVRPIGMVFVLEAAYGNMPGIFAHPAGWGDLLAGSLAAYVLYRFWNKPIPTRWILIVAVVGILDFVSAFFFGFTSSANAVQLFSFDQPNTVVDYPTGLIPLLLVPNALIAHILSLSQLARDRRAG